MSNAAYIDEYRNRWNECQTLFVPDYRKETDTQHLSENYILNEMYYAGKVNNCSLSGSECNLIDNDGKVIAKWRSIDNSGDFHFLIQHGNGKEYLIFRQDLYGYSVLDIAVGRIMQFFPEYSLERGETFIWTNVDYNPITNVLAVSGCYWACPYSTHLFTFDHPMDENQKYVDLIECFDGDYDVYDDVDFVKWDDRDLHVTRYVIETKSNEPVVVTGNEYLKWLADKGQVL